ncbi:hypothetical protein [Arenivirga flava]|uniref:Uncharacterized protein n=1 Tax=Arenivirga flava TaxID=1930060 RepID=A0AA37XA04_9MICO|nr:hypothetical protein [Arenivirga flava]GMA26941.1 hypothetical protein GCM10025874_01940 [Arenivirga flava]
MIALVEQARSDAAIDAVAALAHQVSAEIGGGFERHLDSGGPDRRSTRHLWCVVLATCCRLYDRGFDLADGTLDGRVERIMETLRKDISTARGEESHLPLQAPDRRSVRTRRVRVPEALIKKAVHTVTAAINEIGEEAVFEHLRLIGAITCPDPDRHPDVGKHCLWPSLAGPFKEMLEDGIASEMHTWLRNAYLVVPAHRERDRRAVRPGARHPADPRRSGSVSRRPRAAHRKAVRCISRA